MKLSCGETEVDGLAKCGLKASKIIEYGKNA